MLSTRTLSHTENRTQRKQANVLILGEELVLGLVGIPYLYLKSSTKEETDTGQNYTH